MYPALFLLRLQMLISYTLPNPNGFSESNFLATVFHFSVDFLCLTHIRASGAFATFWPQPIQGSSSSVWVPGGRAGSLDCGCSPLSSSGCVGLLQTRICALEAEPDSWGGGRLRGFSFPRKMVVVGLTSVKWVCLFFKTEWGEHPNESLLGIFLVVSLSWVACYNHLQRWPGAFFFFFVRH